MVESPPERAAGAHERRLSARREERDHLLASLDDLDAEYAAGDIDADDYRVLRADYTTRAAAAIRGVERTEAARAPRTRSWSHTALWTLLIVVVAGLAGLWLADFSGSRLAGDSITGDIRTSVRTRLFQAGEATAQQDFDLATELYDSVLQDDPDNPEALAYRGWLTRLKEGAEAALADLEAAVLSDPSYPDARVFLASVYLERGDATAADRELAALDRLDSAPFIQQLVDQMGLRDSIGAAAAEEAAAVVVPVMLDEGVPFADTAFTVREVALAGEHLAANGRLEDGLALFTAMVQDAPDDPDVRTALGWFVGRASVGLDEGLDTAASHLGAVIASDAERPDAFVYRAFVRFEQGDTAGAAADLASYDALGVTRHDLDALLRDAGLREALT